MLSLNGTWTNSNGEDGDRVEIRHCGDGLFIHGSYMTRGGRLIENIGYAKIEEESISVGTRLKVTWTDTCDSNGSQRGTVHRTIIEIVSPTHLRQVSDGVIKKRFSCDHRTSYGNWKRSIIGSSPRKEKI